MSDFESLPYSILLLLLHILFRYPTSIKLFVDKEFGLFKATFMSTPVKEIVTQLQKFKNHTLRLLNSLKQNLAQKMKTIQSLKTETENLKTNFQNNEDEVQIPCEYVQTLDESTQNLETLISTQWTENNKSALVIQDLIHQVAALRDQLTGINNRLTMLEHPPRAFVVDPILPSNLWPTHEISFYNGSSDNMPFFEWLERLEEQFELAPTTLTDAQKIARLCYYLIGRARRIYNAIEDKTTYQNIVNNLKSNLSSDTIISASRQRLQTCYQSPEEPISAFTERLMPLVTSVYLNENEDFVNKRLLEEFVARMLPDLQYEVNSRKPNSFDKAYDLAIQFEELIRVKKARDHSTMAFYPNKVLSLRYESDEDDHTCENCGYNNSRIEYKLISRYRSRSNSSSPSPPRTGLRFYLFLKVLSLF
jgi:hypothetical protein